MEVLNFETSYSYFKEHSARSIVGDCLDIDFIELKRCLMQLENIQRKNLLNCDFSGLIDILKGSTGELASKLYLKGIFQMDEYYLRNLIFELKKFRNDWAHQNQFNLDDIFRFLK